MESLGKHFLRENPLRITAVDPFWPGVCTVKHKLTELY